MIETGNLTIDRVTTLREQWLEIFSANQMLELDISDCEIADLAGIQLIASFIRSSKAGGGSVKLRGTPSKGLCRVCMLTGLTEKDSLSAEELEEKIKVVL